MQFYVKNVLADYGELLMYKTLATKDLFVVQEKDYLNEEQGKLFHMTVARLLYLSESKTRYFNSGWILMYQREAT